MREVLPRSRLEIQDKPRLKKRVSNQVPSNFPKSNKDRVSNPMSQKLKSENSPSDIPTCAKCDKKHRGEYMVGTGNYFGCEKVGYKVRDCRNVRSQEKGSGQA